MWNPFSWFIDSLAAYSNAFFLLELAFQQAIAFINQKYLINDHNKNMMIVDDKKMIMVIIIVIRDNIDSNEDKYDRNNIYDKITMIKW